jgi:ABC-type branched-subunit amino acid transport system substrate-binding protein
MAGLGTEGGVAVLQALRERLGDRVEIMAHDPFVPIPALVKFAGPAVKGVYLSATDVPPAAREGSPRGRSFARDFGVLEAPVSGVLQAAQATELVLDAIARSDGTRASVLEELREAEVRNGFLGDFRLDRYGDITPAQLAIFRVTGTSARGVGVFEQFRGTVLDRVITVPARLSG